MSSVCFLSLGNEDLERLLKSLALVFHLCIILTHSVSVPSTPIISQIMVPRT